MNEHKDILFMAFSFYRHLNYQEIDDIFHFQLKKKEKESGLCFSDTNIMVSSNQSHLSDLNVNFMFIIS